MFFWIIFFVAAQGQTFSTTYACNNTYRFFNSTSEKTFTLEDVLVVQHERKSCSQRIKYGIDWVAAKFFCSFGIDCIFEHDPMLTDTPINPSRRTQSLYGEVDNDLLFGPELKQAARLIEKWAPYIRRFYQFDPKSTQSTTVVWSRKENYSLEQSPFLDDSLQIMVTQVCST